MTASRMTATPPRTIGQFCAQHNLTMTPQLARMSLAAVAKWYESLSYEPLIKHDPDNRGLPLLEKEDENGSQEPTPETADPDPIKWLSLGDGCWVGKSTHRNLKWHRQMVFVDRAASIYREDAQWAKK